MVCSFHNHCKHILENAAKTVLTGKMHHWLFSQTTQTTKKHCIFLTSDLLWLCE